jgi:hypothetical protein
MPKRSTNSRMSSEQRPLRPALTPEARENQMISLAMDLVEQRLRDGSASSAETTHFLKLASSKERLEMEVMQKQKELLEAKKEDLDSNKRIEALYDEAMKAMRSYSGQQTPQPDIFQGDDHQ